MKLKLKQIWGTDKSLTSATFLTRLNVPPMLVWLLPGFVMVDWPLCIKICCRKRGKYKPRWVKLMVFYHHCSTCWAGVYILQGSLFPSTSQTAIITFRGSQDLLSHFVCAASLGVVWSQDVTTETAFVCFFHCEPQPECTYRWMQLLMCIHYIQLTSPWRKRGLIIVAP